MEIIQILDDVVYLEVETRGRHGIRRTELIASLNKYSYKETSAAIDRCIKKGRVVYADIDATDPLLMDVNPATKMPSFGAKVTHSIVFVSEKTLADAIQHEAQKHGDFHRDGIKVNVTAEQLNRDLCDCPYNFEGESKNRRYGFIDNKIVSESKK